MALRDVPRMTRQWLIRNLPPESERARHAAVVGLTAVQYAVGAALTRVRPKPQPPGAGSAWLDAVKREGFTVVPDFYDPATCRACAAEVDRVLAEYPEYVHHQSDDRIFGMDVASALLARFGDDPTLLGVAEGVFGEPSVNAFTLGARLRYSPGNAGSGEGWHRDSFVVQFKAILYLTDVDADSGPFQFVLGSSKFRTLASDILRARLGFSQNRVSEAQIERLVAAEPERLRTFTAPAGTLILVDTSGIHRGKPIASGNRYALTNYYFTRRYMSDKVYRHFAPVLRDARRGP